MMYSLKRTGHDVDHSEDWSGKEIRWQSVLGQDAAIIRGLFSIVYQERLDDARLFDKLGIAKDHIDNGLLLLSHLFDECAEDVSSFIDRLADEVTWVGSAIHNSDRIDLVIGRRATSGEELVVALNDVDQHANSHIAIAGKPGVGKTQLLMKMLADIRQHGQYTTNYILLDYKGDIAADSRFADITHATVYAIPQDSLPINPFVLSQYDEDAVRISAREKAESFASIDHRFGVVQKGALTTAIQRAYARRAADTRPYPDFREVLQTLEDQYSADGRSPDTVVQILRDLADFKLFWSHDAVQEPLQNVHATTIIVDLSRLPVLKELVGYLIIERLYKEMSALPDSAVESGRRQLRTVLVIDEAHNYLPQKNIFLEKIIREGRSKGLVVALASQSPSDYLQKQFDFRELLEFFFMFQCDGLSSSEIQRVLGCSRGAAVQLEAQIPKLKPFEVVAKPLGDDAEYSFFRADAFYEAY